MKRSDQLRLKDLPYYEREAKWLPVGRSLPPTMSLLARDWRLGYCHHPVKCWYGKNPSGEVGFWDADGRRLRLTMWAERIALPNKFGAKRTWSEMIGRDFASGAECDRAELLWQMQGAALIRDLTFQPPVRLSAAKIQYTPDFRYTDEAGVLVWEEVKGLESEGYRIRENLWGAYGPGPLRVMKTNYRGRWVVARTVYPKGDGVAELVAAAEALLEARVIDSPESADATIALRDAVVRAKVPTC